MKFWQFAVMSTLVSLGSVQADVLKLQGSDTLAGVITDAITQTWPAGKARVCRRRIRHR